MLRHGRNLGIEAIISITSHTDSELRAISDVVLEMGPVQEPCPLNLTPTASIAVMPAISDALALVLMNARMLRRAILGFDITAATSAGPQSLVR
jgi:arabinose-5-phosphate isomerase